MRPCFVIAGNKAVKEFLDKRTADGSTYNGLSDFFFGLFGHSILFSVEPEEAYHFRSVLLPLFSPQAFQCKRKRSESLTSSEETAGWYNEITGEVCDSWMRSEIDPYTKKAMGNSYIDGSPIVLYEAFKKFASQWVMRVFLNATGEEAANLSVLATSHWHGLISVPLNVKVAFLSSSSTYRKAVEAKEKLLEIIEMKIKERKSEFLNTFFDNKGEMDMALVKNHVLVFVCSLIPKALASVLTSFVYTARHWRNQLEDKGQPESLPDKQKLRNILMEILRLWPPFLGAYRVTNQDIEVGDFHVPKGYGVLCATFAAHRDPEIFPNPESFLPCRWENDNAEDADKMLGFGSGPHACVGERVMWDVMIHISKEMVRRYTWDLPDILRYLQNHLKIVHRPQFFLS